ncbi:MAG: hypothetical protein H0W22_07225, partial [Chloroflexi bacterium]|nr:hypothetical protein [Chloroflexota bacterium]
MTTIAVAQRRGPFGRGTCIVGFAVGAIVLYELMLFLALQQEWLVGRSVLPAERAFPVAVQQTINALSIGA